jgi:hypothetical protein
MVPSIAARPVEQRLHSSAVANSEREDGLSHERDDAESLRQLMEPLPGHAR